MSEMSETSETKGRCRSEVDMSGSGGPVTNAIADAIDRLAADVAAIKEAVCGNRITVEETKKIQSYMEWVNKHEQWRREERDAARMERDAAIRERDEARAEVERLKAELAARPAAGRWMTAREKEAIEELLPYAFSGEQVKLLANMLARAGSPPVVGVPPFESYAPEVLHLRYRDAISRAGVKWKEVGRE